MTPEQLALRLQILQLVEQYAAATPAPGAFQPGQTVIPPSGKVVGAPEMKLMVEEGQPFKWPFSSFYCL